MQTWFVAFHHANNSTRIYKKKKKKKLDQMFLRFIGSSHTLGKYSIGGKKIVRVPL
jgi:hypothetical protein